MEVTQTAPNTDAAGLWRVLFGEEEGYLCVASGERNGGPKLVDFGERYFVWPRQSEDAARWCAEQSGAGREVYFCVHLLSISQRRRENAAPVRALWADGDGATLPGGIPEPTVTVESSPGRTQWYWLLTRPVEPKVAERLNKRLILATGADPSGYDLTQLLRPLGSRNHKYPDAPVVRVGEATGEAFDPDALDGMLPTLPEPPDKEPYDGPPDAGFALEDWLETRPGARDAVLGERHDDKARVKYAAVCPWVKEHTGGDTSGTFVGQFPDGALFFHCHHGHCEDRGWTEYREFYEPLAGEYPTVTLVEDDASDTYDTMTPGVGPLRYRGAARPRFPCTPSPRFSDATSGRPRTPKRLPWSSSRCPCSRRWV